MICLNQFYFLVVLFVVFLVTNLCELHRDPGAQQLLAVQVAHRVLGLPAVLELGEPVLALLDQHISDTTVGLEESFNVPNSAFWRKIS